MSNGHMPKEVYILLNPWDGKTLHITEGHSDLDYKYTLEVTN